MLEKFTNSVKKVVGAGVIAAAGLVAQDANAGLKRMDYEPLTTQSVEENAAYKEGVKVSLQKKFEADLKAKGLHGVTLNFSESSKGVSVSGSLIEDVVDTSLIGDSKIVHKEIAGFGVFVSKEGASNKYMLEEELTKAVKEAIDSVPAPVSYDSGYIGSSIDDSGASSHNYTAPTAHSYNYIKPNSPEDETK